MEMIVFFQRPDRPVSILRAADPQADMFALASQVVPDGAPYWVVSLDYADEQSALHEEDRDQWVVNSEYMGREPDGVGSLAQ